MVKILRKEYHPGNIATFSTDNKSKCVNWREHEGRGTPLANDTVQEGVIAINRSEVNFKLVELNLFVVREVQ